MRKRSISAIFLIVIMTAAAFLAGCGSGQEAAQEDEQNTSTPGVNEAYGVSYAMPETDWSYMFNAEQLGTGEELIDLEISGGETENGLEAYWKEALATDELGGEESEPTDSGTKTIGGRECYWYDMCDPGDEELTYWSKVLLIPQADENKYIQIRTDFVTDEDKEKTDAFFEELLNGIEFTDDKGYTANADHISVGGVQIPAQGLKPYQFFYGLMDEETTDGLVSAQIDFDDEAYETGVDQTFAEIDWSENGELQGDGEIEVDGIHCKWYTWLDSLPDSLTHLSHVIMIPNDELQTVMRIEYDFDGEVDDLSQYDGQIKELDDQIHVTQAE